MMKHDTLRRLWTLLLVVVALLTLVGCRRHTDDVSRTVVRLMSGVRGGPNPALVEGLAREYQRRLPYLDIKLTQNAGSIDAVEAIQRGDADVGLVGADVAYLALVGKLDGHPDAFSRLRAISVWVPNSLHFVIRAGTGIRSLKDLKGRRINIGPSSSGTSQMMRIVLTAAGIRPSELHVEVLSFNSGAAQLLEGRLDAMFIASSFPAEAVAAAIRGGGELVAIEGPMTDQLRREYPFLRARKIPAGSYPGQTKLVRTLGVDNVLVCRSGLAETVVYDLTRELFEALPTIASLQPMAPLDVIDAPASPIPLHEGAARYYRERELFR